MQFCGAFYTHRGFENKFVKKCDCGKELYLN